MTRIRFICSMVMIALTVSAAYSADQSMFNYQGRVMVQGIPYTGTGRMKVAILATSGTTVFSLWSNDGSSIGGSEPSGSFDINTTSGVFDVMIGDTSAGMASLPAVLFNRDDELKVRVWFNDGTHGYQQLTPDRRLTNPRRYGLTCVTNPLTVYVNSSDGNDYDNGLTTDTAKRTVQAAVDMLPKSLHAKTIVKLAPGTYTKFSACGFTDMPAELEFQGDMTHDPTLGQALTVSVNGTGSNSGLLISHSSNIIVSGIAFQNFYMGLEVTDSSSEVSINRCKASGCGDSGFNLNTVSSATFNNCHAYGNTGHGFSYAFTCYGSMGGCITESNNNGLFIYWGSTLGLFSDIQVKNNSNGVLGRYNCAIAIGSRLINSGNSVNLNIGSGCSVY